MSLLMEQQFTEYRMTLLQVVIELKSMGVGFIGTQGGDQNGRNFA